MKRDTEAALDQPRGRPAVEVDVYHSGAEKPFAPFLLLLPDEKALPPHPVGSRTWQYWKRVPLGMIAVQPDLAQRHLNHAGFYIQ